MMCNRYMITNKLLRPLSHLTKVPVYRISGLAFRCLTWNNSQATIKYKSPQRLTTNDIQQRFNGLPFSFSIRRRWRVLDLC